MMAIKVMLIGLAMIMVWFGARFIVKIRLFLAERRVLKTYLELIALAVSKHSLGILVDIEKELTLVRYKYYDREKKDVLEFCKTSISVLRKLKKAQREG